MGLDDLLRQVKDAITNHSNDREQHGGYEPSGLLGTIESLFGNHAGNENVASSNQDPYGDPGQQATGNVASSDTDPYGDPGVSVPGNVLSSDRDPYGDPGRQ